MSMSQVNKLITTDGNNRDVRCPIYTTTMLKNLRKILIKHSIFKTDSKSIYY